jgi:hypothetical protein
VPPYGVEPQTIEADEQLQEGPEKAAGGEDEAGAGLEVGSQLGTQCSKVGACGHCPLSPQASQTLVRLTNTNVEVVATRTLI